ncbi:branched-chain amino acid ABC transporter permease [Thermopetrobacter sp. TC1]|uniref:branched-chain amino acid ABC transporter permease n=1 Tax=Thermopetrobacter sp. TC1 TaxID=1495045 RepID=UPI0009DD1AE8|nr:branched-chain amino acid ABC transporter permease [Thermopetrobacter sp. TC1]
MNDPKRNGAAQIQQPPRARPLIRRGARLLLYAEIVLLAALLMAPWLSAWLNLPFWLDLATRMSILAMAAASLNMIMGLAGLVSFGYAAFLGIGGYAVAIPVWHAVYGGADWLAGESGLFHFALAAGLGAGWALLTGFVALRTRGVHFLMITLAFGQMIFYLLSGLEAYGGDDGLTLDLRSQIAGLNLDDAAIMHWLAVAGLLLALLLHAGLKRTFFGLVLRGTKADDQKMRALGYPVFAVQLSLYVLAGALAALSGGLAANHAAFVSPSMAEWTRSGDLLFMVILGGSGRVTGPLTGAAVFVILEEVLSSFTRYWHLPFGLLLIAVALHQAGAFTAFSAQVRARGKQGAMRAEADQ